MLVLQSIRKTYGGNIVLPGLTVSFGMGINGIAGANGCGKTTMLKTVCGLVKPDSGSVQYNSYTINPQSTEWRQRIGYLPQSVGLYNRMTIHEFLDYMLILSGIKELGVRKEKIEYHCAKLNISEYSNKTCGSLSGGVRQRVGLAQAMIHDPEIILLDEPTNNLDMEERERFHGFLNEIKNSRVILYIGHIINELCEISDSIIVLKKGDCVFTGNPQEFHNTAAMAGQMNDTVSLYESAYRMLAR